MPFPRLSLTLALFICGAFALAACGGAARSSPTITPSPYPRASVTIPRAQELFTPFLLTVQPNTSMTWYNDDTISHTISTTWDHSVFLNPVPFSLEVTAGHHASFTLTQPGLYDYFDNIQARWDMTDHRVAAHKGVPNFPLAMEGVIWVQGAISGLPSSASTTIPQRKDEFTTAFIATAQGGKVTWHNRDTDLHFLSLVPGWSAPINPRALATIEIKGTDNAPPTGGTTTVTFSMPGFYYYYCSAHAAINTTWNRAQAHTNASEFPIPMEGFILVV